MIDQEHWAGDYQVPDWIRNSEIDPIDALLSSLNDFISDTSDATVEWSKALLASPLMLHNIMIASITNVGLLQRLNRLQMPMQPLLQYANNPTTLKASSADTNIKFGNSGNEYVDFCVLQNNDPTNTCYYSFDQDSTKSGNEIYTLVAGASVSWNRKFKHLHASCATQLTIGGQAGLTVGAFIRPVAYGGWGVNQQ